MPIRSVPMRPTFHLAVLFAGALSFGCAGKSDERGTSFADGSGGMHNGGGDDGPAGATSASVALETSSWDAELTIHVTDKPAYCSIAADSAHELTIHFDAVADGIELTAGADGVLAVGKLTRQGNTYVSTDPLALSGIPVSALALTATDTDGDGRADRIAGSAHGSDDALMADILCPYSYTVALSGRPDTTDPVLRVARTVLNPLDAVLVQASEPLLTDATLSLSGTTDVPLPARTNDGTDARAVIAFESAAVLPFGGTWQIQGQAHDLAAHALDLSSAISLETLPDPGAIMGEDFESDANSGISTSSVEIVTGVGALPAISGSRSLLIPNGDTATFHLRRSPSAGTLTFRARGIMPEAQTASNAMNVEIGVVGGQRTSTMLSFPTDMNVATEDPDWPTATGIATLSAPLDTDGSDLVVRLSVAAFCTTTPGGGFCPRQASILIDDIAVE